MLHQATLRFYVILKSLQTDGDSAEGERMDKQRVIDIFTAQYGRIIYTFVVLWATLIVGEYTCGVQGL